MKVLFLSLFAVAFTLMLDAHPTRSAEAGEVRACCPECEGTGAAYRSGMRRAPRRYPMLHGIYYSRPLNYRNLFDYPWHARRVPHASSHGYEVPGSWDVPTSSRLRAVGDATPTPRRVE